MVRALRWSRPESVTDGMSREAEVGENVPGVPGQKHIRGVTGHGEDRNETDV